MAHPSDTAGGTDEGAGPWRRRGPGRARSWVAANKDRLPRTYAGITQHSVPYRKAVLAELSPAERGRAWSEHITRYRSAHTELTTGREAVLDEASRVVPDLFRRGPGERAEVARPLEEAAKREFGRSEAVRYSPISAPPTRRRTCPRRSSVPVRRQVTPQFWPRVRAYRLQQRPGQLRHRLGVRLPTATASPSDAPDPVLPCRARRNGRGLRAGSAARRKSGQRQRGQSSWSRAVSITRWKVG
ncbi:bacteriocin fulvocin C-related protein [Streptomyces oceani]|uniref:bacteriocin fulvocin C-related protein n=1 Tax=Streptomyces oceani TaxID=1075402 RepID=UPI001112D0AE